MDPRRPSTSSGREGLRPGAHRKRSNSFPLVEALGCSTPEAELILREGRAAVRSRQARQRGRRAREMGSFRPKDHLKYLDREFALSECSSETAPSNAHDGSRRHSRFPSDATDGSTATIIASAHIADDEPRASTVAKTRPLGDYSANLAKFIQSQLNSIPSYNPAQSSLSPCSCPDLGFSSRTPPQSPMKWTRRPSDAPQSIEIPPIRPPLQSAFSAWSSTDDESDDEIPSLPGTGTLQKVQSYTPSVLGYYEGSSSFLFSSTPLDENDEPGAAERVSLADQAQLRQPSHEHQSPSCNGDYPSSALSTRPQLVSSSVASESSASTASYFECKRPLTLAPGLRDRIIAAVTPPPLAHGIIVSATSPFEGQALANLHDLTVEENMRRVLVDGMSFDMIREFTMPDEGLRRVPTPC